MILEVIVLEYSFKGLDKVIDSINDKMEKAVETALVDSMVYFHEAVNPNVPIDTGALRESFEFELLSPYEIYGEWSAIDPKTNFPYGTFQYYNHKTKSQWITVTMESHKANMARVFERSFLGGLK